MLPWQLLASLLALTAPRAPVQGNPASTRIRFTDVTAASGVAFRHRAARTAEKFLPETMGAGVAMLDFDGDGDLDLYFVQSAPVLPGPSLAQRRNELWRNAGGFRFERVPGAAGAGDVGLGMGACAGDVDGDGDEDLYVTNVGLDALYLWDGKRFERSATLPADDAWTTSCTFLDADGDGDLDLFAAAYVDFDPVSHSPWCGHPDRKLRTYCHPDVFSPVQDRLLLGDGHGGFVEAASERGMGAEKGKGLGVVLDDADGDGDTDLFVANDSTPNALWLQDGGRFHDVGPVSGMAFDEQGRAQGSMGIATGDVDGDGTLDVVVSNLDREGLTLSLGTRREAGAAPIFRDASESSGLRVPTLRDVGFGLELFDADLDGDLDLMVTNGHIMDNVAEIDSSATHAQPVQMFENDGRGRFRLLGPEAGDVSRLRVVGRGLAAGDLDGDGDLDVVITTNDGPPVLLRNDSRRPASFVVLELRGTSCNRDALGARASLVAAAGARRWATVQGGRSYLSQGTRRLHLAAPVGPCSVEVAWPGGAHETFAGLRSGRGWLLVQGASKTPALRLPTPR